MLVEWTRGVGETYAYDAVGFLDAGLEGFGFELVFDIVVTAAVVVFALCC